MKKHFILSFLFLFFYSCSGLSQRGDSPDEIAKNQILDLKNENRFILSIIKADQFKKEYPESKYRAEVEYIKGLAIQEHQGLEAAYAHWFDFLTLFPEYESTDVQKRLQELKGKKDPPKPLGFFEMSYTSELGSSGNVKSIESDNSLGFNFAYFSHRPGQYVHGLYWSISSYRFNEVKSIGGNSIAPKSDVVISHLSIGYSFKVELNKDKIQSIISFGPNFSKVRLFTDRSEKKMHRDIGLNLRASLDFKFYDNKNTDSISGNGKWYLTAGLNSFYLNKLELYQTNKRGFHHSWFIGLKL